MVGRVTVSFGRARDVEGDDGPVEVRVTIAVGPVAYLTHMLDDDEIDVLPVDENFRPVRTASHRPGAGRFEMGSRNKGYRDGHRTHYYYFRFHLSYSLLLIKKAGTDSSSTI